LESINVEGRGSPSLGFKRCRRSLPVTVRTTRYNSQNYPLVTSIMLDDSFFTATAAKTYIRAEYGAVAADIATA